MFLISPISLPSSLPFARTCSLAKARTLTLFEVVQDGRDMGELAGGIMGGMKSTEALWIKDFWRSDGRDGGLFAKSAIYGPIRNPYFSIKAAY